MSPHGDSPRSRRLFRVALPAACALSMTVAAAPGHAADERSVSIDTDGSRFVLGEEVAVSGKLSPERADERIKLRFKRAGGEYEVVGETRTDGEGRYDFDVEARRSGRFRAIAPANGDFEEAESDFAAIDVDATINARTGKHVLRGRDVTVRGTLRPTDAGREVIVQRKKGGDWDRIGEDDTDGDGKYRVPWEPTHIGSFRVRARFKGDDLNGPATRQVSHRVFVYRSAHASWYGPGFYGNTTACGQTLHRDTIGVAHKELPCGTKVQFHYRGETERIEVIDRGPFIAGREWDLTEKAKEKLKFPDTDEIWSTK